VAVAACAAWALRRAYSVEAAVAGHGNRLSFIFTLAFIALVWQMILCNLERPYKVTAAQSGELRRLRTLVHVPVYNEDAAYLGQCLTSVFRQTWLPGFVSVTDDGSAVDYTEAKAAFLAQAAAAGVPAEWIRTPNQGKRHAQGVAVSRHPETDVFITVDSDTTLDPRAIEEGLKPLADPRVHSVAGMILPRNSQKNLLTRVIDMWWTPSQLVDRSSLSAMGAVLVNSGVLAFYRGALMRDNLDGYLNETFFGRPVEFSDDSILTMYALERGKAVQQPTSFAFTAMPENMSHHARQYVRWMRGATIRSFWRFRYLRASGYAFWAHVIGWVQWVLATCIFWTLFAVEPVITRRPDWALLVVPVLIAYGQGLRYFTVRRSDQSRWSQLATYMLTPVTALWVFFGLRVIRWYGMATCLRTGWGTRKKVEVSL
jgi:hyaluronan synthase